MNTKTYTLQELATIPELIDSWVEGISNLADKYGHEVDGYNPDEDCPAEFENEFMMVADRHLVKFNHLGDIISCFESKPTPWKDWLAHLLEVAYEIATERRDLTDEEYGAYESDSGMLADELAHKITDVDVDKIISLVNEIKNRKEA